MECPALHKSVVQSFRSNADTVETDTQHPLPDTTICQAIFTK